MNFLFETLLQKDYICFVNKKRSTQLSIIGTSASLLCAIHCLSLPILLSAGALGLSNLFSNPLVEFSLISISIIFGVLVISKGYAKHKKGLIVFLFTSSALLLLIFGLILQDHTSIYHTLGSVGIAISFLLNWMTQHKIA